MNSNENIEDLGILIGTNNKGNPYYIDEYNNITSNGETTITETETETGTGTNIMANNKSIPKEGKETTPETDIVAKNETITSITKEGKDAKYIEGFSKLINISKPFLFNKNISNNTIMNNKSIDDINYTEGFSSLIKISKPFLLKK